MSDFDSIYPGPRYILKTEYEELEGRFKELEEENKSNGELAQKWGSRVLLDSAEKHRMKAQILDLEVENAELRERAETIRLALRKREVDAGEYSYSSPSWRESEGRQFDDKRPPFNQADEEGGSVMLEFKKHPFSARAWEFFKNGEHLGDISTTRTGKYRIASCHLDEMGGNDLREIADKLDELNRELPMTSFYSPCRCPEFNPTLSGQRVHKDDWRQKCNRGATFSGGQMVCKHCGRHEPKQREQ